MDGRVEVAPGGGDPALHNGESWTADLVVDLDEAGGLVQERGCVLGLALEEGHADPDDDRVHRVDAVAELLP